MGESCARAFFVIEGKGKVTIGSEEADAESGCIIGAPAGVTDQWKNVSERLILLSVLIPSSSYKIADEAAEVEFI